MKFGSITTGIIADGLIFNMDAANRASYVPNATTSYNTLDLSNNGSLQDTGIYSSENGGTWVFDGIDDYISCMDNTALDLTSTLTLNCWINPSSVSGWDAIMYKNKQWTWGAYHMGLNPSGYLSGGVGDSNWRTVQSTSNVLTTGDWQSIGMTWDNSLTTLILYKNGVAIKTDSSFGPYTINGNNNPLVIGMQNNIEWYSGKIANAQIYNRAISATEILHNYNALKGRFI